MTAVVAVVVLEVVGMGLYLATLKPWVLDTLLGGPSEFELKMVVASNGDVVMVAAALAVVGLAFAARSDTAGDPAPSDSASHPGQTASSTTDDDSGFAFGDGE